MRVRKPRRERTRIDPRVLIIIGVLLVVIGVLLFILLYNGHEEITERGTMMFYLKNRDAVVIRDEEVLISSEYARLDYLRSEGADVMSGESLATVYKLGYSDELMQSLLNTREEVYRAQMERIGSTKDSHLDEINEGIQRLRRMIADCIMQGADGDLESLYRQLDNALKERMDFLKDKVQETESLRALYKAVEDKEALLDTWTDTVAAPKTGAVSYYFDGFEQAMNADKLNMLTADLINRALKDKGAASWTTDDHARVCRVVNRERWYVAFLTKSADLVRTARGVEYTVEIEGSGVYTGTALEPIINGSEIVNILEFTDDIGDLLSVRNVKLSVSASVNGIKVKSNAVRNENGLTYLELVMSDSHFTLRIDVLAENNGMVIVRPHEENDVLNEGVRYWNRKR